MRSLTSIGQVTVLILPIEVGKHICLRWTVAFLFAEFLMDGYL